MGDKMKKTSKTNGKIVPVRKKEKKPVTVSEKAILACSILLLAVIMGVIITQCRIENVVISGNESYSQDEIEAAVRQNCIDNTVFYTVWAYFNKNDYLPFVEELDVTFIDQNTILVEVTEKLRAGMIQEMTEYFYFDKDGVVREASERKIKNVPLVTGLKMNDCVLNEKIEPKEENVFAIILKMTQLIIKYDLPVTEIQFNTLSDVRLKTSSIQIKLGTVTELDAKMAELPAVLESLYGKQGILNMESFSETDKIISFEPKKTKTY